MKELFISFIAFYCGLSMANAQDLIRSTFDSDQEEWAASGGILYYRDQAGNPGGFIEFEDDQDGAGVIVAPAKFLGNLTGFNQGTLAFDLINTHDNGMDSLYNYGNVTLSSSSVTASKNVVPLRYYSEWTSFTIPLTAEAWGLTPTGWDSLLSGVTEIKLQADAQWDYWDRTGLDNFTLIPFDFGIASGALPAAHSNDILNPVMPNPVRECATISWNQPFSGKVIVELSDLNGRRIRSLVNEVRSMGYHEIRLHIPGIPPGVYIIRLRVNGIVEEQKMVTL